MTFRAPTGLSDPLLIFKINDGFPVKYNLWKAMAQKNAMPSVTEQAPIPPDRGSNTILPGNFKELRKVSYKVNCCPMASIFSPIAKWILSKTLTNLNFYSLRSAIRGLRRMARRAGISPAIIPISTEKI